MKNWLQAARLRTLPLSLSGMLLGGFLAQSKGYFSWKIFLISVLTTITYQVLSNFANDFGDGIKGTDAHKLGEQRTIASGLISQKAMKNAIIATAIIAFVSTLVLVYLSFYPHFMSELYLFIALGIACIIAALFYTIGKRPYGYLGLGDLFVFIFFGIVAVCGSEFLYTKSFDFYSLLPASAIGFFSVAVLNLNNMRDMPSDALAGKKTLAIRLGLQKAKYYQLLLMFLPFTCGLIYALKLYSKQYESILFMILFIPATVFRRQIIAIKNHEDFDPFLKKVVFLTLFFATLLGLGICIV